MSTVLAFSNIENKHTLYRGEDCVKKLCNSLREHAKNITDFKNKKKIPLTKEELKSHQNGKNCYICRERFSKKFAKAENYSKIKDNYY